MGTACGIAQWAPYSLFLRVTGLLLVKRSHARRQLLQAGVDFSQLGLLLGRTHRAVDADLTALREQLQLAYGQQLVVVRNTELAPLQTCQHGQLFVVGAVVGEEIVDLLLGRFRQVLAPYDGVGWNQRRLPDNLQLRRLGRVGFLQALHAFEIGRASCRERVWQE